jgi:hypothetical protein
MGWLKYQIKSPDRWWLFFRKNDSSIVRMDFTTLCVTFLYKDETVTSLSFSTALPYLSSPV